MPILKRLDFTKQAAILIGFAFLIIGNPKPGYGSEGHADEAPIALQLNNMDDAVNAVAFFSREVDSHVAAGELEKVHVSAFAARDAATSAVLFSNALSESARQELPLVLKRIEAVAVQLDNHGDAGRAPETAAFARKLREYVDALQRLAGIAVRNDWKPTFLEGAPHGASKCPHKANHGGRFTLALNDAYHIEGSYPAAGEFRLHFYDKDSCPISANGFSGKLIFQGGEQQVELAQSDDGTYLTGRLPSAIEPPLSVTAIVQLPNPQTGAIATEHFSYNFYKLSKP